VGRQFGELLKASGVDTVKELRTRKAENLTVKLAEVNAEKNLANAVPTETQVQDWIEKANVTEPMTPTCSVPGMLPCFSTRPFSSCYPRTEYVVAMCAGRIGDVAA